MNDANTFDALPVRRRDVLEIFDTGIKLYRRYFWVVIAWAAIPHLASALPNLLLRNADVFTAGVLPWLVGLLSFFLVPLEIGSVSCCIAGAVRGQPIGFKQCWRFMKPRYWAVVGQYFLTTLACGIAFLVIFFLGALICVFIGFGLEYSHLPGPLKILTWIVVGLVLTVVGTLLSSVVWAWQTMTPIVVCLEDDRRSSAQGRTWDLLQRNWWRTTGLFSLLGLGGMALGGIIGVTLVLSMGLSNLQKAFTGNPGALAAYTSGLEAATMVYALASILGLPLMRLITAVLYLDLRVRKEALDLEWAAHVSAPQAEIDADTVPAPGTSRHGNAATGTVPPTYSPSIPAGEPAPSTSSFGGAGEAAAPVVAAAPGPYMPSSTAPVTGPPVPAMAAPGDGSGFGTSDTGPPATSTPAAMPAPAPVGAEISAAGAAAAQAIQTPDVDSGASATAPALKWESFSPGTPAVPPMPMVTEAPAAVVTPVPEAAPAPSPVPAPAPTSAPAASSPFDTAPPPAPASVVPQVPLTSGESGAGGSSFSSPVSATFAPPSPEHQAAPQAPASPPPATPAPPAPVPSPRPTAAPTDEDDDWPVSSFGGFSS